MRVVGISLRNASMRLITCRLPYVFSMAGLITAP